MLCLGAVQSFAQRYLFKQYGQSDGLENLNVNVMLSDRSGFLWLGTENGLFRYDGIRFESIGTQDGQLYLTALAEDHKGRIWAGTNKGLYLSNPGPLVTGFQQIPYQGRILRVPQREAIAIHGDEILVATQTDQLLSFLPLGERWDSQDFFVRHHLSRPAGKVGAIHVTERGDIWLACGEAMYRITDEAIERFGVAESVPPDQYVEMLTDHNGGLWARGTNHVVYLSSLGRRFQLRDGSRPALLAGVYYKHLSEDGEGRVITPADAGLLRWEHGDWVLIGKAQGFAAGVPVATATAADGSFWIALAGQGLLKWLGYSNLESWTVEDGLLSPLVWGMARERDGAMLFATERGLNRLGSDGHMMNKVHFGNGKTSTHSRLVVAGLDGTVWMSTTPEEVVATPVAGRPASLSFGGRIHHLIADPSGKIWAATEKGLFQMSTKDGRIDAKAVDSPLFTGKAVYNLLCQTQDNCWVLASNSLLHLHHGSWHLVQMDTPGVITRNQDFAFDASGNLWTDGDFDGVATLSLDGDRVTNVNFIKRKPLASNAVVVLQSDRRGWIWVGGDHGIDVFNGQRWAHVTHEDGLIWNDIDEYGFYDSPDGSVWVGTSSGVTRIQRPKEMFTASLPHARILKASYGNQNLPLVNSESHPWTPKPLVMTVASMTYVHDSSMSFLYRMRGVDADWVVSGNGEIRYPQLAPGKYHFELVTEDKSTSLRSQPFVFEFVLTPPWWKSWWFHGLCALGIFAFVAVMWQWRINILVKRQRELERLVKERTHDLHAQATHDGMTGLWNRTAIIEMLSHELQYSQKHGAALTVILLDFDHFKSVNDTHGHLAGDGVLREAASRFQAVLRASDSIGRYGGEEFAVVMPGCDVPGAAERAEHLRIAICGEPFRLGNLVLDVTCSFGVASSSPTLNEVEKLLNDADQALYEAKRLGRNRVEMAKGCLATLHFDGTRF